jgi:putative nucleotidyltransferase with HDIG domain
MEKNIIAKVKASIDKMPPLSPVVNKIIQVANNVSSTAQELTEVIQMDPVLMAKMLKMVNSAYFGLSNDIKSLKQAVVMLGINTIKNAALSSIVLGNISINKNSSFDGESFWIHSFGVGIASKLIAKKIGVDEKLLEEYFAAGLMHDIGRIIINNFFPEETKKIAEVNADKKHSILDIEKNILGLTHEEIGIAIGKKWQFENNFLYSVGRHHHPVTKGSSSIYSMIVSVADSSVRTLDLGNFNEGRVEPVPDEVWRILGIDQETVFSEISSLETEIQKARSFLQ